MRIMERYYFQDEVPDLHEVCARIQQTFHRDVKTEFHSQNMNFFGDTPEDGEEGVKKFFRVVLGIEQNTVLTQAASLTSNDETISLHTYSSRFKHIVLDCCQTKNIFDKNAFELYTFAGQVLEEAGGKTKNTTEEDLKRLQKGSHLSSVLFWSKVAVLAILYFYFHLTLLQLAAIVGIYFIIKEIISVIKTYKAVQRHGWL